MILDLVSLCSDPVLTKILSIIKSVLDKIQLVGPILGIIALIINLIKLMASPEEKKYKSSIKNWAIAIVMLFLLPVIIDLIMSMLLSTIEESNEKFQLASCWKSVSETSNSKSNYYATSNKKKTNFFSGTLANNDVTGSGTSSGSGSDSGSGSSYSYGTNATHKNSINGITFNLYSQTDSRWTNKVFSNGKTTLGDAGCMVTSTAVVSSGYDKSVTPATVFDSKYRHAIPAVGINAFAGKKFSCSSGSTSSSSIISALRQGQIVVIMVYGGGANSSKKGSSKFTGSQHYMALIDISGDKIYVGNGYATYTYGQAGWFSSSDVLTSVQTADYCKVR